jgi:hypothetical protein
MGGCPSGGGEAPRALRILNDFYRAKNFNQTMIDPDYIFNQGPDRDENFSIKVC